jgi:site-specific DNA-methyltransferase (adenine-specific)
VLATYEVHQGDSVELMYRIEPGSVALSVWSPPYNVGKDYEAGRSTEDWERLLAEVIQGHLHALKPAGFCAINIADILCYPDELMPRIQAETIGPRRIKLTRGQVLAAAAELGTESRYVLADHFGVSEQTIDRRLKGVNIRGGKYQTQTRIKHVAGMIENMALDAGLYPYDRRVWKKDPAWANSRWHTSSLRAIDEFEYIFILWKPGETIVNRDRLTPLEWKQWGSRGVWEFPSVRANDDHEAKFPLELPTRLIRLLTDPGDVVLDPFAGSGTSLAAAIRLGRQPIGIELSPPYVALSRRTMRDALESKQL